MAPTAFNISKTEYSCLWWKRMYLFGIQTLIKCLLWKHVFLFVSVHWKRQQSNIDGRFKRQVVKLLIHSLISGLMCLCAFFPPLYLAKDTLCEAFDIWSSFQRVISHSIEYLLFKKKNLKGSAVYLLNVTSCITVNRTDNTYHLPFLLDLSASASANEDRTTLTAKCETGGTATLGKRSGYLPHVTIWKQTHILFNNDFLCSPLYAIVSSSIYVELFA